jgi:hypothetical protein
LGSGLGGRSFARERRLVGEAQLRPYLYRSHWWPDTVGDESGLAQVYSLITLI